MSGCEVRAKNFLFPVCLFNRCVFLRREHVNFGIFWESSCLFELGEGGISSCVFLKPKEGERERRERERERRERRSLVSTRKRCSFEGRDNLCPEMLYGAGHALSSVALPRSFSSHVRKSF